jgi:hypothetical protein
MTTLTPDEKRTMISREIQQEILFQLREVYPAHTCFSADSEEEQRKLAANLNYLEEHGLCVGGVQIGTNGYIMLGASSITAAGLDFLANDGSLSAILGVLTVKLHANTIRDLIAAKIEATAMPAEEKSTLKRRLEGLSETALTGATTDLVQTGLDHLPDAVHWLSKLLGL